MIDFYFAPTPNGWKVAILLEELGLAYTLKPVNIGKGAQFQPDFLAISPGNKIPAIVDHDTGGDPVSVFESGAILLYLAEKTGQFRPKDPGLRKEVTEWLFWQTGFQGPMAGQHSHFRNYAPDEAKSGYAADRYRDQYIQSLSVLERRLTGRDWIVGNAYSIADMQCWPWVLIAKPMGVPLDDHLNLGAWRARIKERPAVQRAVNLGR
ncbi:MAG: glutathione S-transferase N-terminal domain-containing protein [Pseudomonadota bacterium]